MRYKNKDILRVLQNAHKRACSASAYHGNKCAADYRLALLVPFIGVIRRVANNAAAHTATSQQQEV